MPRDRITDGERIGELLASELTGRTDGPLERVRVVDAREIDLDAVAHPEAGAFAFGIDVDRGSSTDGDPVDDGEATNIRLADVYVHPDRLRMDVHRGVTAFAPDTGDDRLRVRRRPGGVVVFVPTGAAVKPAVDCVCAAVTAFRSPADDDHGAD